MANPGVDPDVFNSVVRSYVESGLTLPAAVQKARETTAWGAAPPDGTFDAVGASPGGDQIDPLESARAPIPMERDLVSERRSRLVNAGMDDALAGRVVASEDRVYGGTPADLFDANDTPEGNAALAARIARSKESDRRMGALAAAIAPEAPAVIADRPGFSTFPGGRYDGVLRQRTGPQSTTTMPDDLPPGYFSKQARDQRAEYGDGVDFADLTQEQKDARQRRNHQEENERAQWARQLARATRLAERAGVSVEEALKDIGATPPPGMGSLYFKGVDNRIADERARRDAWRSQVMLSGGRPTPQSIAQINALNELPDDQRNEVIRNRLLQRGEKGGEDSSKMDLLKAELAGTAEREAAARKADFDKLSITLNETARRDEAARVERESQRKSDTDAQNLKWEMEREESRRQHERAMRDSDARLQAMMEQNAIARDELGLKGREMEQKEELQNRAVAEAEQRRREAEAISLAGPGGADIMRGNYDTPAAQEALRTLASKADQTWFGFWQNDAVRMDAALSAMGVSDPAVRKRLVDTYGYSTSEDFFGAGGTGRGTATSYWMAPRLR